MNKDLIAQAIALLQQAISEPEPAPGPVPEPEPPAPIKVPPASAITSVQFQSLGGAQDHVPFTFGQVFAVGHLQPTTGLFGRLENGAEVSLQVDVKALHADGSVRHAIISGAVPTLFDSETRRMDLVPGTTLAPFKSITGPAPRATVIVNIAGVEYRADMGELLKTKSIMRWLDGRLVQEDHVDTPLQDKLRNDHPHLAVRFALRDYAVGRARVDITIENDWAYEPGPQNFTYDVRIEVDTVIVFEQKALTHYHHARWRKVFWVGGEPQVHIRHDPRYLIDTRALPNYDKTTEIKEATLADLHVRWVPAVSSPMAIGLAAPAMTNTGGRWDIGLLPGWAALYLLSMDKRAKDVTIGTSDLAGSWSMHYRDKNTGLPVSLYDYPYMTILGAGGDTRNPATKSWEAFPAYDKKTVFAKYGHDVSHQPNFAYLPYLVTGDYYHLEELQFWAMYDAFASNPGYRENRKGLLKPEQVRGQAWGLRTIAEAAYITPDCHPLKTVFVGIVDSNLDWYNAEYTNNPAANKHGFLSHGYALAYNGGRGIGPWQDDYFTQAVGHAAELGFEKAVPLLKWKAQFPIQRMTADGICYVHGAMYTMNVRDAAGVFYASMKEAFDASIAEPLRKPKCGSAEMAAALKLAPGEMTGYSSSTHGYPSNMQPALAYAADYAGEEGKKAWARFMSRSVKPDYGTSPQFAIVPR